MCIFVSKIILNLGDPKNRKFPFLSFDFGVKYDLGMFYIPFKLNKKTQRKPELKFILDEGRPQVG